MELSTSKSSDPSSHADWLKKIFDAATGAHGQLWAASGFSPVSQSTELPFETALMALKALENLNSELEGVPTNAFRLWSDHDSRWDVYDGTLWIESTKSMDPKQAKQIAIELHSVRSQITSIYHLRRTQRSGPGSAKTKQMELLWGSSKPKAFPVTELGVNYEIRLSEGGMSSGLFLDQLLARLKIRSEIQTLASARVLNLFGYTGAFALLALRAGATEATTVDLSKAHCNWVRRNFELNSGWLQKGARSPTLQTHPSALKILCRDAVKYLVAQTPDQLDVIVCDPPTFARDKESKKVFRLEDKAAGLLRLCARALKPGGLLYFSFNTANSETRQKIASSTFQELLSAGLNLEDTLSGPAAPSPLLGFFFRKRH